MTERDKYYLMALGKVPGVGNMLAKNLVAYCGGPEKVFSTPRGILMKVPGIGSKIASAIVEADPVVLAERERKFVSEEGIRCLAYLDEGYPNILKTIPDAPLLLYIRGSLDLNAQPPAVAIVGTRKPSPLGRKLAADFATGLASKGIPIISGLAYGIDAEAHKATLDAGGLTVAVVAHGLDIIYPQAHIALAKEIVANGGAIITEYPSGTELMDKRFPERNRIIAGLALGTLVVESAEKGGALVTARVANDYNREVYAIPGDLGRPTAAGCNNLIRDNLAKLVTSPAEILADLGLDELLLPGTASAVQQFRTINVPLMADEQEVLNVLNREPQLLDVLSARLNIPPGQLVSTLLTLEFKGYVRQLPGRRFVRE